MNDDEDTGDEELGGALSQYAPDVSGIMPDSPGSGLSYGSDIEASPDTKMGGLTTANPVTALQMGVERMKQLTQLKQQMAQQTAMRQAAMQQLAQMYESPIQGGDRGGFLALGRSMATNPNPIAGAIEGMQGMEEAKRKLAERDWARKASAQKIRAEAEGQNMTDLVNQGKLDVAMTTPAKGEAGHNWQLTQTDSGPAWTRVDAAGNPEVKHIGKSKDQAQTSTRILSEIKKTADTRDSAFLDQAKGNTTEAAKLKDAWVRNTYNTNPIIKKFGPDVMLSENNGPLSPVQQKSKEKEQQKASEAMGKGFGDQFNKLQDGANSAQNKINQLDRMDQLLEGVSTGKLTPKGTEVAAWAKSFGLDIDSKLGNKEAANALANQFALELRNPSGGAGMPGAMSDSDRKYLSEMAPNISMSEKGRKEVAGTFRRLAERDIEIAKRARDYKKTHNGTLDEGFYDELAEWSTKTPLFSTKENKAAAAATHSHPKDIQDLLGKYGKH